MASPAVLARSLVKDFGRVRAVDGLGFSVARGEIFALLGANGAGKTTTLRMLLSLVRPDSGTLELDLHGDGRPASPADVGYLPEERGLFREAPVGRTIAYFGVLRGLTRRRAEAEAAAWMARLGLEQRAHEKPDALSKGNQQKVQLAAALVHRPRLAVLDEPFSGLDPVNQELLLEILRELRDAGTTVLLSAHQMQLVERIADHLLIVESGREVLAGTLDEVRRAAGRGTRLRVRMRPPLPVEALTRLAGVEQVEAGEDGVADLLLGNGTELGPVLGEVARLGPVLAVHSEDAALHDIYLRAVSEARG
jgi:ABC-2 type transport system ATP-binding protein